MLSAQYKNLALKYGLFSKNLYSINCYSKSQYNINKCRSEVGLIGKHYRFASQKPNMPTQNEEKKPEQKNTQQSDFLWKLNLALNMVGIGAGFYFPKEALLFVLTASSMFQAYESSKSISVIKQLIEKAAKATSEQSANILPQIRRQLLKIVINMGLLLTASIGIGLGFNDYSLQGFSLIVFNFWILSNIHYNGSPRGYIYAFFAFFAFHYLYFQKIFESNQQKLPFQRP